MKPTYTTNGSTASKKVFHFAMFVLRILCSSSPHDVEEFLNSHRQPTHTNELESCAQFNVSC